MNRRHSIACGLVLAVNSAVAMDGMIGAANAIVADADWVQISPYGEFDNSVGLQIFGRAEADAMVSEFGTLAAKAANRWRGLPFYIGHPDDPATGDDYPDKKAYGWIKEVQARNDGLWGRVKWSTPGRELIEEGHYQYLSPYWGMRAINGRKGAFQPVVLISVGLTNNPNIPVLPVGANQTTTGSSDTMTKEQLEALRKALNLPDTATADQIISAANAAHQITTTHTAAVTAKNDAETKLLTVTGEKESLDRSAKAANSALAISEEKFRGERRARIDDMLATAVNEGRLKESQRPEWAGKLATDFDAESKKLAALKAALNTKVRTANLGDRKAQAVSAGAGDVTAINELVSKKVKETGLGHHDAFVAVRNDPENAALFAPESEEADD